MNVTHYLLYITEVNKTYSLGIAVQPTTSNIIDLFNRLFSAKYNTVLECGGEDPLYIPGDPNRLIFARGFIQSAFHEIAHWCIAGEKRRMLNDFGYWYIPDGRSPIVQKRFEKVEIKPQALEWVFSSAAGMPFFVSTDNLSGNITSDIRFKIEVQKSALNLIKKGLPKRAELFKKNLLEQYSKDRTFEHYWEKVENKNLLPA